MFTNSGGRVRESKAEDTGYRAWRLRFEDGEPLLASVTREYTWRPDSEGVVRSDLGAEDFAASERGLYSLKNRESVKPFQQVGPLSGRVSPVGSVYETEVGYRYPAARVGALHRNVECYICREQATHVVRGEETVFFLCDADYKKLKDLLNLEKYSEINISELLDRLAAKYGAKVED